ASLGLLTLGIINAGPILKMTQTMVSRALSSEFVQYAEMCGLPRRVVLRQAVRAALPAIVTIVSVLYGFLIGGAVLVEIVFSWGGAGQYAVQGRRIINIVRNPGPSLGAGTAKFYSAAEIVAEWSLKLSTSRVTGTK